MWNRITPSEPKRQGIERISAEYGVTTPPSNSAGNAETAMQTLLRLADVAVERVEGSDDLHYSTEDWLSLVFTQSNHVILAPTAQSELRTRLRDWIGEGGITANNAALALICRLRPASRG